LIVDAVGECARSDGLVGAEAAPIWARRYVASVHATSVGAACLIDAERLFASPEAEIRAAIGQPVEARRINMSS